MKELLMIKQTLHQWNYYIDNKYTTAILTDHKNLKYLKTIKTLKKCLAHWVLEFAEYNLNIKYHKDSETVVPDALSHRPDFMSKTPVNWAEKMWSVSLWHLDQDSLWLKFMIAFINEGKKSLKKLQKHVVDVQDQFETHKGHLSDSLLYHKVSEGAVTPFLKLQFRADFIKKMHTEYNHLKYSDLLKVIQL